MEPFGSVEVLILAQSPIDEARHRVLEAQILLNIGALIIRIGFWGPLYYNSNKEPPKIVLVII